MLVPAQVEERAANSPSNLPSSVIPLARRILRARGGERGVLRRDGAVDDEARAGSVWNSGVSAGSLTQSCAQASRPRSDSTALLSRKQLFLCAHPATFFRGHATVLAFSPLHLFRQCSPVLRRVFEVGLERRIDCLCRALPRMNCSPSIVVCP